MEFTKGVDSSVHTKNQTQICRAALFIASQTRKHQNVLGRRMDKLWYIQKMEYLSVLKRNELLSHEKMWKKFKCILLSERTQF